MSDFETLSKIIKERRSVFPAMYLDKEIDDETILAILDNANWAPTHRKTEPWRFKVIKGDKLKNLSEFLGAFYKHNVAAEDFSEMKFKKTLKKPLQSGAVIAICMERDKEERVPEWEEVAAVACAVQNMWLSCTALNIGSYWSSPKSIHEMGAILNLKDSEKCLGLFYMGYRKEVEINSERTNIESKIEWI